MGQLSFYSADARPRALSDLEGVLCAPGRLFVFGRSAARLSVVLGAPLPSQDAPVGPDEVLPDESHEAATNDTNAVDDVADHRSGAPPVRTPPSAVDVDDLAHLDLDPGEIAALLGEPPAPEEEHPPAEPPAGPPDDAPARRGRYLPDPVTEWRAHALRCAFRGRGVDAGIERLDDGRPVVRSTYRADLVALAGCWADGLRKAVPAGFELDGPRLRLWVLAAGRYDGRTYTLGLDPEAPHLHEVLLTASRHAGLGATLGGVNGGVPVLRIVGSRRQGRLGELVGSPPRDLVDGVWP